MATITKQQQVMHVREVLLRVIGESPTPWSKIVSEIRTTEGLHIKNWLTEVRGPLQYMLDVREIERVHDLSTECYRKR
jgi:hypothetical protein